MPSTRNVNLRINEVSVTEAKLHSGKERVELVFTNPLLGEFTADESFTFELLELVIPPEIRSRLPNGGWRKVSPRILIALPRCGAVKISASTM